MPIYEYKCKDCEKVIEIFQRTYEGKSISCSHCGSKNIEKIFSVPGVVKLDDSSTKGTTCCGREERCDTPPCSTGDGCRRDR